MILAICAEEGISGVKSYKVMSVGSLEDCELFAQDFAISIMYDSPGVMAIFEEDAQKMGFEEDSFEWEEYIDFLVVENVSYNMWTIDEVKESKSKLEKEFSENMEDFLKKYHAVEIEE